jgi:hypothetical protein
MRGALILTSSMLIVGFGVAVTCTPILHHFVSTRFIQPYNTTTKLLFTHADVYCNETGGYLCLFEKYTRKWGLIELKDCISVKTFLPTTLFEWRVVQQNLDKLGKHTRHTNALNLASCYGVEFKEKNILPGTIKIML